MVEAVVSVIIPCYRQAYFLPEAIENVLAQTHSETEIVVVDDGSDNFQRLPRAMRRWVACGRGTRDARRRATLVIVPAAENILFSWMIA